ncbi:mitochondrial inner membrane protein required for protein import, partial [Blyttiomyces sp. JEL0837]
STVEPPSVKLLPDILPEPYQRPFTLCVELNDTLCRLVWDKEVGWRVATRPGLNQFLSYLSRYYEIVVFTTSHNYLAQPIIDTIDPRRYIMYHLYRDSTRLMGAKHVKDISCLNRDLGKVLILDTDAANFQLQPENGITVKAWKGEENDMELPKLMKFLEELALLATLSNISDLRPFLNAVKAHDSSDVYMGWTARKDELREMIAERERQMYGSTGANGGVSMIPGAQSPSTTSSGQSVVGWLVGSLFGRGLQGHAGGAPAAAPTSPLSPAKPAGSVTVIDLIEQAAAEEFQNHLKDQKNMLAQFEEEKRKMEEAQAKQIQEMKEKKLKMFDYMMGAGAVPPPGSPEAAAAASAAQKQG